MSTGYSPGHSPNQQYMQPQPGQQYSTGQPGQQYMQPQQGQQYMQPQHGQQYSTAQPGQPYRQSNGPQQYAPPQQSYSEYGFINEAAAKVIMNPNTWQAGSEYVNRNVNELINVRGIKYYWNVNNSYVLRKLKLLFFPFLNKSWSRLVIRNEENGHVDGFKPPKVDLNAPDMYIPVMSYVTYILMVGTAMGLENKFTPEVLTLTASTALGVVVMQVLFLRLGIYLLSIQSLESPISMFDLVSYCGYQFVSLIVMQLVMFFTNEGFLKFALLGYLSLALGWFMVRSLRYICLPSADANNNIANPPSTPQRKRRVYFLFTFVVVQIITFWWLALSLTADPVSKLKKTSK